MLNKIVKKMIHDNNIKKKKNRFWQNLFTFVFLITTLMMFCSCGENIPETSIQSLDGQYFLRGSHAHCTIRGSGTHLSVSLAPSRFPLPVHCFSWLCPRPSDDSLNLAILVMMAIDGFFAALFSPTIAVISLKLNPTALR